MPYKFNPFTGNFDEVESGGSGGVSDGDKGDITVSGGGTIWTIDTGVVETTNLGGDITTAGKALLDDADASAQRTTLGLGNSSTLDTGTTNSTVATGDRGLPAGGTSAQILSKNSGTDYDVNWETLDLGDIADVDFSTPPSDGQALIYDNATSTWIPGSAGSGSPGGSDTQIQYNDSGNFAGSADLTWDDTGKELGVGGDINLDDGGTYTTTLQSITATADRFISLPDATGVVALVQGINGAVLFNNAGVSGGGNLGYSSTAGTFGYISGRGTVTQATNKSTGVTLDAPCGAITMNGAALSADTTVSFTLTNSSIAATDLLVLNHISGGTAGAYILNAQAAAGSASINVRNVTAGSLSEAIVIGFAIIKT